MRYDNPFAKNNNTKSYKKLNWMEDDEKKSSILLSKNRISSSKIHIYPEGTKEKENEVLDSGKPLRKIRKSTTNKKAKNCEKNEKINNEYGIAKL